MFLRLLLKQDSDCLNFSSLGKEFHNLGPDEISLVNSSALDEHSYSIDY